MDIAALKAAATRATPGEWRVDMFDRLEIRAVAAGPLSIAQTMGGVAGGRGGAFEVSNDDCVANATYIALANPTAILSLIERVEALEEALEPSGDTKAAYMGEFSVRLPDIDEDGHEYTRHVNVPWTTIKEIMAAIRARALSPTNTQADE